MTYLLVKILILVLRQWVPMILISFVVRTAMYDFTPWISFTVCLHLLIIEIGQGSRGVPLSRLALVHSQLLKELHRPLFFTIVYRGGRGSGEGLYLF